MLMADLGSDGGKWAPGDLGVCYILLPMGRFLGVKVTGRIWMSNEDGTCISCRLMTTCECEPLRRPTLVPRRRRVA